MPTTESRLLPFQPTPMTAAQLAVVSFLARYAGHTHELYSYQLRRWFEWCDGNVGWIHWSGSNGPTSSSTSAGSARPDSWRPRPTR